MNTIVKSFDDAARYEASIRRLVPGYDALHSVLHRLAAQLAPTTGRALVVGPGPGDELVALARALPDGVSVEAVEPEPSMIALARHRVERAGLSDRVDVHRGYLADLPGDSWEGRYCLAVSTLVGHLIPDDGTREAFYADLGRLLRPGGRALVVELTHAGDWHDVFVRTHLDWAAQEGLAQDRLKVMEGRLRHGFHALSARRSDALAEAAGLRRETTFFSCLGVTGWILERRPPS